MPSARRSLRGRSLVPVAQLHSRPIAQKQRRKAEKPFLFLGSFEEEEKKFKKNIRKYFPNQPALRGGG